VILKFLLGRVLPRERVVKLDLPPMYFADDAVEALGCIMRAVSEGTISPSEGAEAATLVNTYTKAIEHGRCGEKARFSGGPDKGGRVP
jgi:hypothetical protein